MRRVEELKAPYPAGGAVPRDDHVRRSQRSRHQRQMTTPTSDDDSNVICTSLIPTKIGGSLAEFDKLQVYSNICYLAYAILKT